MDPDEPQVLYNVGCIYALLGQKSKALECVAQVLEHGEWWRIWMSHDPDLASLHEDPRFQELVGQAPESKASEG